MHAERGTSGWSGLHDTRPARHTQREQVKLTTAERKLISTSAPQNRHELSLRRLASQWRWKRGERQLGGAVPVTAFEADATSAGRQEIRATHKHSVSARVSIGHALGEAEAAGSWQAL